MTPDMLRDRLRAVLDAAAATKGDVPCPMCHGSGQVERPIRSITQSDVAAAIGTGRTSISSFLAGRQTFTLAVGLRLVAWLDEQEARRLTAHHPEPR